MKKVTWTAGALILSVIGSVGCANNDDSDSPDGKDEVALIDGKADNLFGVCDEKKLLAVLNDPLVDAQELKDQGVHSRAASNIVETRNGADGLAGTPDDVVFDDLVTVDKVPWVGKTAMSQLADIVADLCIEPTGTSTEVIFSPQPIAESHVARVAELIDDAQVSLDIAMYSFSDAGVTEAIERAVNRGVMVRLMFEPARDERSDPDGTKSDQMERMGVDVRYINKIMHHKYVIIDGPQDLAAQTSVDQGILVTGSANWSNGAATRFDENTVVVHGNGELNLRFQKEFNHMWTHSRDFNNGMDHEFIETDSIEETMIPDDPSTDVVMTSDNFRTFTSSTHGETFSVVRGMNTVSDRLVEEIQNARKSIWVASGHLRSRPIALALIEKAQTQPQVDIKVYLDGQEYVSDFVHDKEVDAQQDCIDDAAGNENKIQDCLDKSYHYSWDIDDAGIPMRFKYYAYRWHYSYADQMHHKYMIIDGARVLSGSYNYSDNAEHNTLENVVVFEKEGFPGLVEKFEDNFLSIWDTGEGLYDPLVDQIKTTDTVPLVFEPMAITKDQVRNLKSIISSECPQANSTDFRTQPQRHQTCFK